MNIFLKIIVILAALFFYGSVFTNFYLKYKKKKDSVTKGLYISGIVLNAIVVIINWIMNGYVPFVSMYQVLTFLSVCFPLAYLYVKHVHKLAWTFPMFAICSSVALTGVACMNSALIWHFPPALQSIWFLPHVFSYMLSYSLAAVSFVLTILTFFAKDDYEKAEKSVYKAEVTISKAAAAVDKAEGTFQEGDRSLIEQSDRPIIQKAERVLKPGGSTKQDKQEKIEKAIYVFIMTAFPFMTMGMLFGAIWANECWGNYWSWDPKETWALITWALYALYLHCRRHKELKKMCSVILILAFVALLMTFIGVNLFGLEAVHNYA